MYKGFYFFCLWIVSNTSAQVGSGGIPEGLKNNLNIDIPLIEMPPVDTIEIMAQEESVKNKSSHKVFEFAKNFSTNLSTSNSGIWITLPDKRNLWCVKITAKSAYAIGIVFVNFKLKSGEKLFIYNNNEVLGAFTNENNNSSQVFPVKPIKGDEVIIEFSSPFQKNEQGTFTIETVSHAYKNIYVDPGPCNRDINCPIGKDWQITKRSVCRILIYPYNSPAYGCTGTLLNNTNYDNRPLVLTANHCLFNDYDANRSVFFFNYESPYCGGPNENVNHSLSGSKVDATLYDYDFTLLELYNHPPAFFLPYYSGWSLDTLNNLDTVASIHHPQAGLKKISFSYRHPKKSDVIPDPGDPQYANNGFWWITRWDTGVTEHGSSGGALFDRDHRVVGSLWGGDSQCGYPYNDYFEILNKSYFFNKTDSSKQLKYWLDPLNTSVSYVNGWDPFPRQFLGCDTSSNIDTSEKVAVLPYELGNGYYSGTNSDSIFKFAEKFQATDSIYLTGALFNINKIGSKGGIIIKVYKGDTIPETNLFESFVPFNNLKVNSLNYIEIYPKLNIRGVYFISYEVPYQSPDTFNIYQAYPRYTNNKNSAYLFYKGNWKPLNEITPGNWGSSFDIRPISCSIKATELKQTDYKTALKVFPCPAFQSLFIEFSNNNEIVKNIEVFDIFGRINNIKYFVKSDRIELNLNNLKPGFYVLKVNTRINSYSSKFIKGK